MTLGYSACCDECSHVDHSPDGTLSAAAAIAGFRADGWHITPDGHALCPQHHRAEQANADLGPGSPTHYPMPGEHR